MLTVYLLRHGETSWNAEGNKYCGRTDIPLTDNGIRQARALRKQVSGFSLDAVYASTLQRSWRTAEIAAGNHQVVRDKRLVELDFGGWEGKPKKQFIPEHPVWWENWMDDPATTQAGGSGETGRELINRVNEFFTDAMDKHPRGTILVVAHNGVNRLFLAHKLGMPLGNYRKIVQDNSTISRFTLDEEAELRLHQLNTYLPNH